jgi:hypothetical protein
MPHELCYSYTNVERPWWWYRCTHNQHAHNVCWQVLLEAEGAVVLELQCMEFTASAIHILVDLDGIGSVCKPMSKKAYEAMSPPELMAHIQQERRGLRALSLTPWNQE